METRLGSRLFHGCTAWVRVEITQSATGWTAFAKPDTNGARLVRINHCGQEKLAELPNAGRTN